MACLSEATPSHGEVSSSDRTEIAIYSFTPAKLFNISRKGVKDSETPFVDSIFQLPLTNIEHLPLLVDVTLPAFGRVREPLPVVYNLHNKTAFEQEVEVSVEPSDAFMFQGVKQVGLTLHSQTSVFLV